MRFAFSIPGVRSTVGATSRLEGLAEFLRASQASSDPLPADVVDEIGRLQRRWSEETDVPWTM